MNPESRTPNFETATSDTPRSAFSQVAVVGAVTMTLAGVSLLVTAVLVLSLWIPAWVATLAATVLLTATSLAVFASGDPASRLRGTPVNRGYAAFPAVPVGDGAQPAPVMEPTFHESGVHASAAQSVEAAREIEAAEFEEALPDNDEHESVAAGHVERLLNPAERTGLGQHVGLGQRTTKPLFQKTAQR